MRFWRWGKKKHSAAAAVPRTVVFQPKRSAVQERKLKVPTTRGFANTLADRRAAPRDHGAEDIRSLQLRVWVVMAGVSLVYGVVGARLALVALMPPAEPRASIREMPSEALRRGNIYDRNGVLVAATLQVYSLYVDPKRVLDKDEIIARLPTALPEVNMTRLAAQLNDPNRRFIWVKRRLSPDEAARVNALGLPGLEFREEFVRVYPHQDLAGHLLGAVDVDNTGLAGVERGFDAQLRRGEDVHLALDVRLQQALRNRVETATRESGSKAGWGVVMHAPTREVVALVSLPDFDPNHFGKATPDQRFNRVTLGSYEMGSTFKLFTLAQGLVDGKITPETVFDCRYPVSIGRFTIRDFHAKKTMLTATEVMRYSSNIGAVKIADLSGPEAQKAFLSKLGMLAPINAGIAEVGPVKYPLNWGRIQNFTIAYGHGMSVTPLHLVTAVASLADGLYIPPTVLQRSAVDPSSTLGQSLAVKPQVVISNQTTLSQLHDLMRDVVLNGSGRSAQLAGYDIGGKTGTAEKIAGHGYAKDRNLVSFVGVLPTRNPEYVTLIMLDEPQKGYETGGKSAAPAVGAFYRDLTQLVALPPDMPEVMAYRDLLAKSKRSETDPGASWVLSDLRMRRGMAGGVPLKIGAGEDVRD